MCLLLCSSSFLQARPRACQSTGSLASRASVETVYTMFIACCSIVLSFPKGLGCRGGLTTEWPHRGSVQLGWGGGAASGIQHTHTMSRIQTAYSMLQSAWSLAAGVRAVGGVAPGFFAQSFASTAVPATRATGNVPPGHINSDLSATACHIGLGRRRDLTMRQDLCLWDGNTKKSLADVLGVGLGRSPPPARWWFRL